MMDPVGRQCARAALGIVVIWVATLACWAEPARRVVTVRDAIEMTKLADPQYVGGGSSRGRVALLSPDGRRFIVVLRRGSVDANANIYSMLLWSSQGILKGDTAPRTLLEMSSSSNHGAIDNPAWSRDGKTITFIGERAGQDRQLFEIDVQTGALKQITRHPTRVVSFSRDASGTSVAYAAERPDVDLWDRETALRGLVVSAQLLPDLMVGRRSSQYRGKQDEVDWFVQDSRGIRPLPLPAQIGRGVIASMSPDGGHVVAAVHMPRVEVLPQWRDYDDYNLRYQLSFEAQQEPKSAGPESLLSRYELIDTRSGESRPLLNAPASMSLETTAVWSPDGKSVILNNTFLPLDIRDPVERRSRTRGLVTVEVDAVAGKFKRIGTRCQSASSWGKDLICTAEPSDLSELIERYRQILAHQEAGTSFEGQLHAPEDRPLRTVRYRKISGRWRETPASEERDEWAVYLKEGMNFPPEIHARRTARADDVLLQDLNPQLRSLRMGRVEEITWKWAENQQIKGGLYYPVDYRPGHRYPLVIQTHEWNPFRFWIDGPWTTAYAAQPLAGRGVFVLQLLDEFIPESFGADGQLKEVEKAVAIYRGAIDHLDDRGLIDARRVGVVGFSHTCFYVKYVLAHEPSMFAAATAAEGEDGGYLQFITGMNYYVDADSLYGGGPFGPHLSRWMERSPGFGLDRVRAPLRINVLNPRFVLAEWEWFSGLRQLGKPVEMIMLEDGEHVLEKPAERIVSQEGNVDWFDFWLNGHEDGTAGKAAQYGRWRQLREQRDDRRN